MVKTPVQHVRVLFLLIVGMALALWINVNNDYTTGLTFSLIGIATFVVYQKAASIFNGK